jgi:hypothetical protein
MRTESIMHPWTFYALEVARERELEAHRYRLARDAKTRRPERHSRIRRSAAVALAALARGTTGAVRRLDDCVADDLQHALTPSE